VILGSDGPAGSGVQPLRMWALLSNLSGILAERVCAQRTAGGKLLESEQLGDIPGIGMVMIDGIVRCGRSRNTPPAAEVPQVVAAQG
jgi:enamidase